MRALVKVLAALVATVAVAYGGLFLFAQVASDPTSGPAIAFGNVDGKLQVALVTCPQSGSRIKRISLFSSSLDNPPPSSLLWEVRDPPPQQHRTSVFTIGHMNGFRVETKPLVDGIPDTFQIEFESKDGVIDAVLAGRNDFYTLESGEWFDGQDRVDLSDLKAPGC